MNTRVLPVIVLLGACQRTSTPTTDPVSHPHQATGSTSIAQSKGTTDGPAVVSEDVMLTRLEQVALEYPDATIERLALGDLAFPTDAAEARALNGHTVVLITATSQEATELPPARVYTSCDGAETELMPVASRKSLIEADWGRVVGPFRFDGLYLVPLEPVGRPECKLLLDYAKNRVGQYIPVFEAGIPPDVVVLPATELPSEAAVRDIVAREYPLVLQ